MPCQVSKWCVNEGQPLDFPNRYYCLSWPIYTVLRCGSFILARDYDRILYTAYVITIFVVSGCGHNSIPYMTTDLKNRGRCKHVPNRKLICKRHKKRDVKKGEVNRKCKFVFRGMVKMYLMGDNSIEYCHLKIEQHGPPNIARGARNSTPCACSSNKCLRSPPPAEFVTNLRAPQKPLLVTLRTQGV